MKTKLAEQMFNLSQKQVNPSFKRYLSKVKTEIKKSARNGQTSIELSVRSLKNKKKETVMFSHDIYSCLKSFLKKEGFSVNKDSSFIVSHSGVRLTVSW